MKRLAALLMVVGLALFSYSMLSASDQAAEEQEPYDEDLYGPEDPIVWTKPVKAVVFYHKTHTYELEMECDACHDDLFYMEAGAAEEEDDFTMEALYEGKYCGACHDGSTAFASDTRCTTCHIGARGYARLMGEGEAEGHGSGH